MGLLPVRIDVPVLAALSRPSPLSRLGIYAVPAPVMFCALRHKTRQVLRGLRCRKATAIPAASPIPPRCHARCLPIGSTGHANAPYAECLRRQTLPLVAPPVRATLIGESGGGWLIGWPPRSHALPPSRAGARRNAGAVPLLSTAPAPDQHRIMVLIMPTLILSGAHPHGLRFKMSGSRTRHTF